MVPLCPEATYVELVVKLIAHRGAALLFVGRALAGRDQSQMTSVL